MPADSRFVSVSLAEIYSQAQPILRHHVAFSRLCGSLLSGIVLRDLDILRGTDQSCLRWSLVWRSGVSLRLNLGNVPVAGTVQE